MVQVDLSEQDIAFQEDAYSEESTAISSSDLLERIDSPEDLRKLDIPELVRLARELRERIIAVVSKNGGHLAPSLGATELTIALHYVFDTPRDKIIWDVGHQAYAHKLLTGRRDSFSSLRQYKGISGFLKRSESPYDVFGAGHASTSISAAFGFACARDLSGEVNPIRQHPNIIPAKP